MSQITIDLDDELEAWIRIRAKAEGISVSKWSARRIQADDGKGWSQEVLDSFGTWGDDVPDLDTIPFGEDVRREEL